MADLEALARRSVELFDVADWQGMRDLCGPGYVYEETGTGRRVDTEEFLAACAAWRTAFPDCRGEVLRVVAAGDTTVSEIRWTGTHSGPLATGGPVLPPTGRSMTVLATLWHRWQDERILEARHHLDLLSMLTQLGAVPAPATV